MITFVGQKTRGVAQLVSALRSGRRGRKFESSHPDCLKQDAVVNQVITTAFFFVVEKVVENIYSTFSAETSIFTCIIQYCYDLNTCFIDKYDNIKIIHIKRLTIGINIVYLSTNQENYE